MASPGSILHSPRLLTVIFSLLQLLKAVLTLALVWMSANLFGAGVGREAWVIGWGAQMWLFKLLFTPVNESFRARFLQIRTQQGEEEALRSFASLLFVVTTSSMLLILGLSFCSESFLNLIAPGYTNLAGREQIRLMTLYLLPILLLSEWTYLFTALLNCYRNFYLPEIFSLLTIVLNLLLLYFAADRFGIYSFVIANYASLFALFILLFYQTYRLGLLRAGTFLNAGVFRFFSFAAPLYIAAVAMQLNVWAERRMLSFLALGSNAALDYARKFVDAPVIFVASLSTAIVAPLLAGIAGKELGAAFQKECFLFLRACLLVLTPALMLCIVNTSDLIRAFLLHGQFDLRWEPSLVQSLRWFGLGLPGTVVCMIAGQIMIVRKNVNAYAWVTVVAQLAPVVVNYLYFRNYGLGIFALSWAAFQTIAAIVLLRLSGLSGAQEFKSILKLVFVCGLSVLLAQWVLFCIPANTPALRIIMLILSNLLFLLILLIVFRMEEVLVIKRLWQKMLRS